MGNATLRILVISAMCLAAACKPSEAETNPRATSSDQRASLLQTSTPAVYATCAEAIADGAAPLNEGDEGYTEELDSDGDGVACENFSHDQDFEKVGDTSQCTGDCSGHNAGFDWARDHDITDESDCSGYSQSFIEGCQTYVSEGDADENDDSEDDT